MALSGPVQGENPLRRENLSHGSVSDKVTLFYRLLPSSGRIRVAGLPYFSAAPIKWGKSMPCALAPLLP
jgi:hypothetical protein